MHIEGCTPSVQTVSRMASSWNIPHITYVGTDESLGNKQEFSTLTRLSFTMNVFARFYVEVFDAFSWTNIANIYEMNVYLPNLVGLSLQVRSGKFVFSVSALNDKPSTL